ncbi:chemotaxis protein CheA [Nitrosophilus alvini]|uniref:chemotaxis protein CheA n=1 Tax=Nitrosophilus alvini TaxID=2714855 RepID=UPI00190A85E3|nr:chemotaxis protein CheA [Nitrosophilus alvini]
MRVEFSEDMKEIFDEFMLEAEEILESLDQDLVELEENPTDKDLLNKIFRGMHTLKGGAGFLGLESIIELAHKIEDIFNKLRNDEMELDSDKMDIILEGIDTLKNGIISLKEEGVIPDKEDIAEILNKLEKLLSGEIVRTNPETNSQEEIFWSGDERIEEKVGTKEKEEQKNIKIVFKEGVDPDIQNLIIKYPGKNFAQILDEIILLPPDERDMSVVEKLEKLVEEGKEVEDLIEEMITEETKSEETPEISKKAEVEAVEKKTPSTEKKKTKKQPKKEEVETIRIDINRVEILMNLVGELVLDRNRIIKLASRFSNVQGDMETAEELSEAIAGMSRSVSDLQEAVMKLRMQPVKKIFSKFPRIVRDLSKKLGKNIRLELEGEDTEIDRSILNKLEDPLIHLVRNSIDHGIETPEERKKAGKSETGTIKLSAFQEGDRIIVAIEDDGKGIDPEIIKQKAIEKGLIKPEQSVNMNDKEVFELIFLPGFSTAEELSDVSGRGVGMDVVASTIHSLRGTIEVDSEKGRGTKIVMKLPLTVAIIRTLMVGVNNRIFAIPLFSVAEIIKYDSEKIKNVGHFKSLMLRDDVYLMFSLNELFDIEESGKSKFIIIVNVGEKSLAIAVDELYGEEEIVIKPLGELLSDAKGIAGATITGDGKVVLILDINSLINDKKSELTGVV